MKDTLIGIDIGGTNIKIGVLKKSGKLIKNTSIPTQVPDPPESIIKRLAAAVKELCSQAKVNMDTIIKIGVGCPGPLNSKNGVIYRAPNLTGWDNFPLKKNIEKHLNIPTVVNNDANAATYGEYWLGAGKGYDTVVCLTLGTGIGGGMILNGKLFKGIDDTASHIGHMTVVPDGPRCNCGNKGCIEQYASATAMAKWAVKHIKAGAKTKLLKMADGKYKKYNCKTYFRSSIPG